MLVLCYHAVSSSWPADLSVTPERLEQQLGFLRSRGYEGATFSRAVESPPADRTVAVTFDDSYASVLRLARPILARLGMPGTVFVPTDFAGSGEPMAWPGIEHWLATPDREELVPMSWDELASLRDLGWEIGAHSRSHPRLTQISDSALDDELAGARVALEDHLGQPCRSIAYPYGDVDERVVRAAASAGYATGAGLPSRFHAPRPLLWPRVGVWHGDDLAHFRRQTSRPVRRLQHSPAWPGIERGVKLARKVEARFRRA